MDMTLAIRCATADDGDALVTLWERCALTRPWNDPRRDITRRLAIEDDLFLVGSPVAAERDRPAIGHLVADENDRPVAGNSGEDDNTPIVASAMGGYDGHRGWVYYVAVDPTHRGHGHGAELMRELERRLLARGCPKLNLQVRSDNPTARAFYRRLGYAMDETASLGKRLIDDT